ncbi:MAG: T9SS type B sorting domain-containing protein [Bacteroidales bacterium]|nr:T9SS type B sorting domain-containing protein [Bacteroidales bacterium]
MKKYLYSTLLLLLCTVTGAFAQSMIITGGNDHALAICNKGLVYGWGYNDKGQLCLKNKSLNSKTVVAEPAEVNLPQGLTFSQVTAGSGSHSVALSCYGTVYCWGMNDGYQCGRETPNVISDEPVLVYKGEVTQGYDEKGDPSPTGQYLGGVKYISATTNASMAILEDGTAVWWGKNKMLGSNIPNANPKYLRDANGDILQNVIHITGGDDNMLIIVGDSPDAQMGIVYSAGEMNGRGCTTDGCDEMAAPVEIGSSATASSGTFLVDVRTSGISDKSAFAVEGKTGYVYAWGDNGWGCQVTGDNSNRVQFKYATKVVSGEYEQISNEPFLTNVVQVVGGNGCGTAITEEGYLLFWGNDNPNGNSGGVAPTSSLGNAGNTCETGPVFGYYCKGEKGTNEVRVDDAVSIARGDMAGFMVNRDGDYYVWGSTAKTGTSDHTGIMGTGLEIDLSRCLKKIEINCEEPDICPTPFMSGPINKCPGETIQVYSGFTHVTGKDSVYFYRWTWRENANSQNIKELNESKYDDDFSVRKLDKYNKPTIDVTDPGFYEVEILYIGTNVPCDNCPEAKAKVQVIDMEMPIDTLVPTSCVAKPVAPTATDQINYEFEVNTKFYSTGDKTTWVVYNDLVNGTALDTLEVLAGDGGSFSVTGDNVKVNENIPVDTTYSIYVEDATTIETVLLKDAKVAAGTFPSTAAVSRYNTGQPYYITFQLMAPVKLGTINIPIRNGNNANTGKFTASIYSTDLASGGGANNNKYVTKSLIKSVSADYKLTTQSQDTVLTLDFEGFELDANTIRGTIYTIMFSASSQIFVPVTQRALGSIASSDGAITFVEGGSHSSPTLGDYANVDGKTIAYNFTFFKMTDYTCGRIELRSRFKCPPCNPLDPTTVKITVSDPTVTDTIFLCKESPAVTLSVSGVKGAPSAEAGAKFDILWYNNSLASAAAQTDPDTTASTFATPIAWVASKAGTSEKVFLQARDNEEPDGDCHEEDSIVIVYNEIPVAPAIADMQFCVNAATADKPNLNDTLATAKFSDFNVIWTNPTAIPDLQGADGGTAGTKTYEYTVTSKSTGCVSAAATFDVIVLDKPVAPTPKNLDFVVTPNTTVKVEQGATATTGHTLTWYDNTDKSAYPAPGSSESPTVTLDAEKKESFWVAQISDIGGCISDTVRIDVTVNDAPIPSAQNDTVCLGTSVDVTSLVTIGDPLNPTDPYAAVWYEKFGDKKDSIKTVDVPTKVKLDPNTVGEQKFYVAQKNLGTGAVSNIKEFSVYVLGVEKPKVDSTEISYCAGDPAQILTATEMKNKDACYMADAFVWTLDGKGVASPLPETNVTNDTSYTYRVHQTYTIPTDQSQVCVGDSVEVTVKVTHVPQLAVKSVLYLKADAKADGSFDKNLMQQETGLITGNLEANSTLNWYEEDCTTPTQGTPTPTIDPTVPVGQDQNVTYCVSQTVNGCESEKVKVDVKISDALPPEVTHLIYCEGSVIDDLTAQPGLLDNTDVATNYTLLWYTSKPASVNDPFVSKGTIFAMNNQIATVTDNKVTTTSYWVAQQNNTTMAISTATELKVIVYPKPVVATVAPAPICGNDGNELELNNTSIWSVSNESNIKAAGVTSITPQFFDTQGNAMGASSKVSVSGTYKIGATYAVASTLGGVKIVDATCTGTPVDVAVQVHNLTDLKITGTNETCPSTKVTLTATAISTDPGLITYTWGGDAQGSTGDVYTSPELSNITGTPYSYTVKAVAGACTLEIDPSKAHNLEIGDGPVLGNMVATETGNSKSPLTFAGDIPRDFYSCGGEVMLTVGYTKTAGDFVWFDESGNQVGTGATYTVPSTTFAGSRKFKVEYTNQCPTFAEITIRDIPLTATALQTGDTVMCEGDQFTVSLSYTCAETPTIQWHKDGRDISSTEAILNIKKTIVDDGGLYSFTVTNRGCTVKGNSKTLKVKPYIQVTAQPGDIIVPRHGNQTITLPITVPASGQVNSISWEENGKEVYNGNPYTLTDVVADHKYAIKLEDPEHCPANTDVTVLVDAELQLKTQFKDTVCLGTGEVMVIDTTGTGSFRQLNVIPTLVVTANDGTNTIDITDKIVKVGDMLHIPLAPEVNTTYTVDFKYGTQALSSSEYVVVIPAIKVTTPATPTLCEGEQVKLEVKDIQPVGTTVSWVADPTIIDGQTTPIVTVQPTYTSGVNHQSVAVYKVIATNSICGTSKSYEVTVNVDEPISGEITGINAICEGQSTMLDASSFQAGTYSWMAAGTPLGVMDVINVSPAQTTTYELNMTRGLCSASASYQVIVSTNPVIVRIDSVALRDREIILDPSYGTAPYTYSVDSREPDVNSIKKDLSFSTHIAKVVDAAGCSTTMQFAMEPPAISIPEHFSPNGDGTNDTWVCPSLADVYPNSLVSIYDRFGKLLIQFLGADANGWDGTYQGVPMPSTDYWYQIDIEEINMQYVGHFTLIRR